MPEPVTIAWDRGTVSGRFVDAAGATGVLLAHGAGVGQDHEWMVYVRDGLAAAGIPVLTFNYPYMEAGRKAPNPAPTLLACHRAALSELRTRVKQVVLAGKSMGGRMGSHLAADGADVAGSHVIRASAKALLHLKRPKRTDEEEEDDGRRILSVVSKMKS